MAKQTGFPYKVLSAVALSTLLLSTTNAFAVESQNDSTATPTISDIIKKGFQSEQTATTQDKFHYGDQSANGLNEMFDPNEKVRVIVEVEEPSSTSTSTKKEQFTQKQDRVISEFKKKKLVSPKIRHRYYQGFNGFSMETEYKSLKDIESLPGVTNVHIARTFQPSMATSKELVQAQKVWESYGYQGEGLVVGVVDSGIDWTHKDLTITEKGKQQEKWTNTSIQGKLAETAVNDVWYSDKVPTGYDWADNDTDVIPHGANGNPHGTHVSGTIGANGDESNDGVLGIAPGVQLLAEKVFSDNGGGAYEDDIIAGINHAVEMGADVINMSLGSDAGWVGEDDDPVQKAIREATEHGTLVVVAGGNAAYSTENNFIPRSLKPYAENPDIGTVGQPGTSPYALSVASYENTKIHMNSLKTSDGYTLPYKDQTQYNLKLSNSLTPDQSYDLVYVGEGKTADFNGKDVNGKIVVAKPIPANGYGTYTYIQTEAKKRGAKAIILVPPSGLGDYPYLTVSPYYTPIASTGQAVGADLISKLTSGQNVKMQLSKGVLVDNPAKDTMSYFSSYGAPYTLDFKPEISAPGGNIYSTIPGNQYDVYSGTSMATPHVAGGSALVLQSLYNKGFTHSEETALKTKIALMNTSKIVMDPRTNNEVPYSPRIQGSGLMQIQNAIKTPAIITNKKAPLEQAGSVALKEIKSDSVSFNLNLEAFEGKNAKDLEYIAYVDLLTDNTENKSFDYDNDGKTDFSKEYLSLTSKRVQGAVTFINGKPVSNTTGATIKIKPGQQKNLEVTILLPKNLKKEMFLEGFVRLVPSGENKDSAVPLNVPYMGFYGDWDKPQNIDPAAYSDDAFLGYTTLWDDMTDYPIGYNRQTGEIETEHIAVSPNSIVPGIFPSFTAFRNLKKVEMYVENENGKLVDYFGDFSEFTGDGTPMKFRKNSMGSGNYFYKFDNIAAFGHYFFDERDANGNLLPDGTYNYVIKTTLDYKNAKPQSMKLPIKVDSVAPKATDIQVTPKDGKYEISFKASDGINGSGYKGAIVFVNGNYYETEIGATSILVKEQPKSIVVVGVDYAYNQGYTVWGDPSYIDESMVVSYFSVMNATDVNKDKPAKITAFANNRVNWTFNLKDANGKVLDSFKVNNEHSLYGIQWIPDEDLPNGTYYISADVVTKDGFKVTTTPKKVTVLQK
ncbi:S8 family serine peptidase [Gottfriedia sp. NPDC057991]|uniref:S8 family serine peptidase n=1 Tax=Gottfriedia sp. NPDC057991 TaxID=3346298 RepID=UPI0036D7FE8C